jgi:hypothetical protein
VEKSVLSLEFFFLNLALASCNSSNTNVFSSEVVGVRGRGETGHLLGNYGSVAACNRKRGLLSY